VAIAGDSAFRNGSPPIGDLLGDSGLRLEAHLPTVIDEAWLLRLTVAGIGATPIPRYRSGRLLSAANPHRHRTSSTVVPRVVGYCGDRLQVPRRWSRAVEFAGEGLIAPGAAMQGRHAAEQT